MTLTHSGSRELRFPASYAWIDVIGFAVEGAADDRELLAALIAHERYDRDFLGPWREERDGIHGRRRLATISVGTFRARDVDESREHLLIWGRVADPDVVATGALDQLLDAELPPDAMVYELPPATEEEEHEIGWTTGFGTGFHEFVVISADRTRLTLLVATDD